MRTRTIWILAGALAFGSAGCDRFDSTPDGGPEPPSAALLVDGAEVADAAVGSYSLGDLSSDSPWLPGTPAVVPAGSELGVVLGPGLEPGTWTAAYVPADALQAQPANLAEGGEAITFDPPPPGRWSVQVNVQFTGGGSAAFYWQFDVAAP